MNIRKNVIILGFGLLLISVGLYFKSTSNVEISLQATSISNSVDHSEIGFIPIQEIQLGMKVPGENPVSPLDKSLGEVDPKTWKQICCTVTKPDGTKSSVSLLRPNRWFYKNNISENSKFYFNLPESGIKGDATVDSISPCPEIQDGPGHIVTGKFQHDSNDIWDLKVEGSDTCIGTTGLHPFFSVTRGRFVAACKLEPGEKLLGLNGNEVLVHSISSRATPSEVYNLEIHGVHVFHVGNVALLVHNDCFQYLTSVLNFGDSDARKIAQLAADKKWRQAISEIEKIAGSGEAARSFIRYVRANSGGGVTLLLRTELALLRTNLIRTARAVLTPNKKYYTPEGTTYIADSSGRLSTIKFSLKGPNDVKARGAARTAKSSDTTPLGESLSNVSGDVGFHGRADAAKGIETFPNIFPGSGKLNNSDFKSIELAFTKAARRGKKVDVEVKGIYGAGSTEIRPSHIKITVSRQGKEWTFTFSNSSSYQKLTRVQKNELKILLGLKTR